MSPYEDTRSQEVKTDVFSNMLQNTDQLHLKVFSLFILCNPCLDFLKLFTQFNQEMQHVNTQLNA